MGEPSLERLKKVLEKVDFSKGFATTQELRKAGIRDSRELTSLCRAGVLIRHHRGVYKRNKTDKAHKMRLIANKIPKGIFAESTMLHMYGLINKRPIYTLAVPRSLSHHKRNEIDGIPISVYYIDDKRLLETGKIELRRFGVYGYDLERTICDCFSRRNKLKKKLGDDFLLEDISRRYLDNPNRNLEKLVKYMDKLNLSIATRKEIEKHILSKI